jgi:hypothetical protein
MVEFDLIPITLLTSNLLCRITKNLLLSQKDIELTTALDVSTKAVEIALQAPLAVSHRTLSTYHLFSRLPRAAVDPPKNERCPD